MNITLDIPEDKAEKLTKLLETLADNVDGLESLLRTVSKLNESGILAALEGFAEGFDEGFNYMARPELMSAIGNLMIIIYTISKIDQAILYEISEKLPKGIIAMHEKLKEPRHKAGLLDILKLLEDPDTVAFLKGMQAMIREENLK